jgi:hypothetical protein
MSQQRNCTRCGHPDHWHRLDDATNVSPTDPAAKFRCVGYDCDVGGPLPSRPCNCPAFVAPTEKPE